MMTIKRISQLVVDLPLRPSHSRPNGARGEERLAACRDVKSAQGAARVVVQCPKRVTSQKTIG